MMKRIAVVAAAVLTLGMMSQLTPVRAARFEGAGAVQVKIDYKGKGTVDASHRVWVFVFDTPSIGSGSMPIAMDSVEKNGAVATFDVAGDKVWIAVAYDESGTMTGDGPPPPGSPIAIYGGNPAAPEAVATGAKAPVTITFDDSQRMP
jgi:hypothetical protein